MSDRSFNLSGPLQKVFSAILCYAILLSWNHMYAQTEEKNDGTAKEAVKEEDIPEVKIKIFPSKVETNDVLFLKVRFINSTDKTINGSAPYTIFGDYFYVWLKRPRKSQFQEIQPVKEKIHWLGTGGIDIQPEEEFVRYYLLAWGKSGVITNKPGNYKLKVSSTNFNREYQGEIENFGMLESSSISYTVTDGNAISTELLQKHES